MHVSGAYLVVKKYVADIVKFDESRIGLGLRSDVAWSHEALDLRKYKYVMNVGAKVTVFNERSKFKNARVLCNCHYCLDQIRITNSSGGQLAEYEV